MKALLCLIVAVLAAVAVAQRSTFETTPMDWSSQTYSSLVVLFPVTTKKDLLVYPALDSEGQYLAVRRRNNQGSYVQVANVTEGFNADAYTITNGNLVGFFSAGGITLFNIDENNQMSNTSLVPLQSGHLLSDNTLVGFDPVEVDGNYTIRTYQYSVTNMNWTEVAGAALNIPFSVAVHSIAATYRAYDNHLVILDTSVPAQFSVRIYERQPDLSWDLVEIVPVNNTCSNVYYNGVDTLALFSLMVEGSSAGVVYMYTKINGQWVEQTFSTSSVGYRPPGYFGLSIDFVGTTNILLSAGLEGFVGVPQAGKVLLVSQNSAGRWEPAFDLVGEDLFGIGVGANDHDIIISSLFIDDSFQQLTFRTAPLCLTAPMNVTCNDQQATNCSDVFIAELYTINDPQCAGVITTSIKELGLVNNQELSAEFTFTRGFGDDVTCTATVTCPAPPIAEVVPVTTKVSGSNVLRFGLASVLAYAAMLL